MALSAIQEDVPEIHCEIVSHSIQKNATSSMTRNRSVAQSKDEFFVKSLSIQRPDEDEPEVDARSDLKMHGPIHAQHSALSSSKMPPLFQSESSITTMLKPRLTLSAFRGPSANITQTDPSRRLQDFYDLDRPGFTGVLGHGAFSTVRLALRKCDSTPVAVKSIAKHEALRSRRLRPGKYLEEWEILRRMRGHQYIIQLLDVFETDEEIQLVLEYCEGGELFNAIQRKRNRSYAMRRGQYSEQQAACIANQILRALCDIHAAGIVHRDLKPENILLWSDNENSVRVKLCDFGMARSVLQKGKDDERRQGDTSPLSPDVSGTCAAIGGSYYMAPELQYGPSYDTSVDIYSLGVTLYIVLCGFPPVFSGPDADQVMFPLSYWKDISEDAKNLVRRMLSADPSLRITAAEALRDRWIWNHRFSISHALSPRTSRGRFVQNKSEDVITVAVRRLSKNKHKHMKVRKRRSSRKSQLLSPKRQRLGAVNNSASTALMALADLYRDVAQSPSAKVISSVVNHNAMESGAAFKRSPLPTLSV